MRARRGHTRARGKDQARALAVILLSLPDPNTKARQVWIGATITRIWLTRRNAGASASGCGRIGNAFGRVLAELSKLAFSNVLDFMRIGADGHPVVDFSRLTRDQAAPLVEVTVDDFRDGRGDDARNVRRVRFKLGDKRQALVDIGKCLGLFKTRSS